MKVTAGLGEAGVEVLDDGHGARRHAAANGHDGHGLEGLRERVAGLHGRSKPGAGAAGGLQARGPVPVPAP